jgi:hypothetical protein
MNIRNSICGKWSSWKEKKPESKVMAVGAVISVVVVVLMAGLLIVSGSQISMTDFLSAYLAPITASLALLWMVVNSFLQRLQIAQQQYELSLHRDVLGRTASSTFSQLFVMFNDEHQKALERIARRITVTLDQVEIPNSDADHIEYLLNQPKLAQVLISRANADDSEFLREHLQHYSEVQEQLRSLTESASADEATKQMFDVIISVRPSYQLYKVVQFVLESKSS